MAARILYIGAAVIVALVLAGLILLARATGGGMPLTGWIALGVGAGLTLLVGSGLFALAFYSARAGYDDIDRPEDGPPR